MAQALQNQTWKRVKQYKPIIKAGSEISEAIAVYASWGLGVNYIIAELSELFEQQITPGQIYYHAKYYGVKISDYRRGIMSPKVKQVINKLKREFS